MESNKPLMMNNTNSFSIYWWGVATHKKNYRMKGLVKGQVEANLLSDASSRLQPFESQGNERNC